MRAGGRAGSDRMLRLLKIRNIALAENVDLSFAQGMNCLTGETGAGKSIIIDSISALLGLRVKKDIVRSGCDSGRVTGEFTGISGETAEAINSVLPPNSPRVSAGDSVVLEREISQGGRHVCRVCGRAVNSAGLKKIGETLIDIHGQNESRLLTDNISQLRLIDAFAGERVAAELDSYRTMLSEYRSLRRSLADLSGSPAERARAMDLLGYQIREIDGAQLSPDEEEYLVERLKFLSHAEKIRELLVDAVYAAQGEDDSEGVVGLLERIMSDTGKAAELSDSLEGLRNAAESIFYEVKDFIAELRNASIKAEYDPQEADLAGRRLDYLYRLKNKYGNSYEEIMKYRDSAQKKLDFLNDSEKNAAEITERLTDLSGKLLDSASELSRLRQDAGNAFSKRIASELEELEMGGTEFETDVTFFYEPAENGFAEFGSDGLDDVEFMISPNPGQPLKPLSRIASGGELSRIMLAVKSVQSSSDNIPTLIFDEIDNGISGVAANRIARKLKTLSNDRQIICVTHHAQLAAVADEHIFVSKSVSEGNTATSVKNLYDKDRVREIARLLDGDDLSEISLKHASELLRIFSAN